MNREQQWTTSAWEQKCQNLLLIPNVTQSPNWRKVMNKLSRQQVKSPGCNTGLICGDLVNGLTTSLYRHVACGWQTFPWYVVYCRWQRLTSWGTLWSSPPPAPSPTPSSWSAGTDKRTWRPLAPPSSLAWRPTSISSHCWVWAKTCL